MQITLHLDPKDPQTKLLLEQIKVVTQTQPRRSNNPIQALVNFSLSLLERGGQRLVDGVANTLQRWWSQRKGQVDLDTHKLLS